MSKEQVTPEQLAEQLRTERQRLVVERTDDQERRRLDAQYRADLAELEARHASQTRSRRERERDEVAEAALHALYRHATRAGTRARIRADIHRSAEMRALRVAAVQRGALIVGLPVLLAFGGWSTAGVQAGMARLLDLHHGTAGWWMAWAVEPAVLAIVAGIIIVRALLRSAGGDTDGRATLVEWGMLSVSIALNMVGGWTGQSTGWTAVAEMLGHSIGACGAALTAWLMGLIVDYASHARPWDGAPRIADLDLSGPARTAGSAPVAPVALAVVEPARDDLAALVDVVQPTPAEVVEREVARQLADLPQPPTPAAPHRPRLRSGQLLRPRRMAATRPAINVTVEMPAKAPRPATDPATDGRSTTGAKPAKKAANTGEKVAGLLRKQPAMTQADVAARLQIGERTVRRYWPKQTAAINGHDHTQQ